MPGKLRAYKDFEWALARPIDQSWVREGLARMGTVCEWPTCDAPATQAFESIHTAAYLCDGCTLRLQMHPGMCARLDDALYERFREGFDFIHQVELTGGELLERVEDYPRQERAAIRRSISAQRRDMRTALEALRAEGLASPGMPDRDLLAIRGYAVEESGILPGLILLTQRGVANHTVPPVSVTDQMRANMVRTDHEAHPSEK